MRIHALILAAVTVALGISAVAQTVVSFEGIDASQISRPEFDVDPNGAVGTKQYMEWTNVAFQAYDKVTDLPVWPTPQSGISPWTDNGITSCSTIGGDAVILFDRLASRWVVAAHSSQSNNYNFCIAVSSTDDLTVATWYAYVFPMNSYLGKNSQGNVYFPDWPRVGTWPDAYYVSMDLNDVNLSYREVGFLACAFDRTNMLINGTANAPICFEQPQPVTTTTYLGHGLNPADVEGTTAPPEGRDEFFASIENPVLDGKTTTSTTFNLWDFHTDWQIPTSSTFTQTVLTTAAYEPGCYLPANPVHTECVPEPSTATTGQYIDSVGDRFMPRMSYRNFGSYESFVVSHTVQPASSNQQTGIRWYELRGSGTPSIYQYGTISPDNTTYRFMPSIAEDAMGNAAVGYSVSSSALHPGMNASYFNLNSSTSTTEIPLFDGAGDEENTYHMGDYSSMTVDPENGCTFWYVNQYFPTNQVGSEISWGTRISNFTVPGCGPPALVPSTLTFSAQAVGASSAPQNITLSNGEEATLNIASINFSGADPSDFSETNNCNGSVAPGSSCTFSVTFTPGAVGSRTATLNVDDNGSNSPQTAALTGTGVVAVTLSSSSVSFGSVLLDTVATAKPVTLTNNQSIPLTNISIAIIGAAAYSQINTCGTSIPANGTCTITVSFAPTATGPQTATVNISDSANNSPQTISLTGAGMLPLYLSPTALNFGKQAVGSTSPSKTINITNREKVSVTFNSETITGTDPSDFSVISTTCSTLLPNATCTVFITFTPKVKGNRTATLSLSDSATNSPQAAKLAGMGD
ncbi:MAG TPA: choice-of-anchor D domain-containing protein [Candidatus Binatia bacterium]|nr:choice-of-anchor D domain-containing protein [Candidatus Binatia bacterium]